MEGSLGQRLIGTRDESRDVLVLGRWPGWLKALRSVLLLLLAAAVLFAGLKTRDYLIATAEKPPQRPNVERVRAVEVAIAQRETITPTLEAFGEIIAGRSVDLRPLVGGEVRSISPDLVDGGIIKAGEALLAVDRFTFEGALLSARSELAETKARQAETVTRIAAERDALESAEEQADIAQRELDRIRTLFRNRSATQAQLDQALTRQSTAAAAVDARRNQIAVLEAQSAREAAPLDRLEFALRNAERDLANTALVAPFDGLVSNAAADIGKAVTPNERVATLVDIARLEVRFAVSDAQFARLSQGRTPLEGRSVTVRWSSGPDDIERKAIIARVGPAANARNGGFDVIARLEPGQGSFWRPGVFVSVLLDDKTHENVVRLPSTAIFPGNVVYRIGEEGRVAEVPVTILGHVGETVLVEGAIAAGAKLVATRLADIGPGLKVRDVAAAPPAATPASASTQPKP